MGGKTRNIAIQLVLQQCCRTSCTFFVARFSVPLGRRLSLQIMRLHFFYSAVIANGRERFSTDNSGEISLKNAVAVIEISSQDVENELYMN